MIFSDLFFSDNKEKIYSVIISILMHILGSGSTEMEERRLIVT